MHILLKIYYFLLFISLDILLYLRLGRSILKTEFWLKIVAGVLITTFIIHLPFLHIPYLMRFKNFVTMCGMVIQLLIVYFIGILATRRIKRRILPDKVKEYQNGKKGVLGLFMGEIMKSSKGRIDPQKTNQLLIKELESM